MKIEKRDRDVNDGQDGVIESYVSLGEKQLVLEDSLEVSLISWGTKTNNVHCAPTMARGYTSIPLLPQGTNY